MEDLTNPGTWHKVGDGSRYPLRRQCWVWDRAYDRAVRAEWTGDRWENGSPYRVLDVSHWMTIPVPDHPRSLA